MTKPKRQFPSEGGSYAADKTGKIKRVEGTKPAEEAPALAAPSTPTPVEPKETN